ncbi:6-phosphogluconolactonase, cycloisomerase 2 family [Granulicella pectinivorans]|jgi:6-phosphogluconolactonase (cycloisomerase 2 family)|uniref:6-phosphogluconolactonase, cycloisomerase 2 family n=1 Tax=Granulicella pectinivorans TaxID=474950 RepID=A0A1I6MP78_9BACT|nr:beta-propeller fold lactonase family protein [Granulicella pectinivorans]SFS17417.1 6-phosphogluconolactonase, cycloisomerase 2 family [Granulicella pectinivorans]
MRFSPQYLFRLALCAAIPALSGCGNFFVYPGTGGGSGSGSTTSYAYVANATTTNLAAFALNSGKLVSVSGSPYSLGISPTSLVVTPANTYLYVGTAVALYGFSINTTTGQLTALNSGQALASVNVVSLDVSPDGNWLLALDASGVTVDEYAINTSTGLLNAATGATYSITGNGVSAPRAIKFAPSGAFVFAALGTGGDAVFNFNTSTGALTYNTSLAGSTTSSDNALTVDSTSTHLYIARSGTGAGVTAYTISSNGALNSVSGSPFAAGGGPYSVVIDATGDYLYAGNRTDGTISGYTIATSGALTPISGSPFASGVNVNSLGRDSLGKYIVAASLGGSSDLTMYSFDATTAGKLNVASTATTGTDPTGAIAVAMTH